MDTSIEETENDLELAWKKTKRNIRRQCFANNPYIINFVESDKDEWLEKLGAELPNFRPSGCRIIDAPKSDWQVRPGSVLCIEDAVIYSWLLLQAYSDIKSALSWSRNEKRFSRILGERDRDRWTKYQLGWKKFGEKSLEIMDNGYDVVIFTDIAGFYENIIIQELLSDFRSIGVEEEVTQLLGECLHRWAITPGRSIPQGYYPSDILSEIYLNTIDQMLENNRILHLRYADDFRIFCETKEDAVERIRFLTEKCRGKGLNLQKAKTEIKSGGKARTKIKGKVPEIEELDDELREEIEESWEDDYSSPYNLPSELEDLQKTTEDDISLKALIHGFEQHIEGNPEFDSSLFHWLISRLGALDNEEKAEYCLSLLTTRPEETGPILKKYLQRLSEKEKYGNQLAEFVLSNKSLYDYQEFQIIQWVWENDVVTSKTKDMARKLRASPGTQNHTDNYAIAYLGQYGNTADRLEIYQDYDYISDKVKKAIILKSIEKMEKSKRNKRYAEAQADNFFIQQAIKSSK